LPYPASTPGHDVTSSVMTSLGVLSSLMGPPGGSGCRPRPYKLK
jgi:hypothetical protein